MPNVHNTHNKDNQMGNCHSCRKMGSCTEMLWEGQTGICNILENLSTCALSLVCSLAINFKNVSLYVEYMGVLSKAVWLGVCCLHYDIKPLL